MSHSTDKHDNDNDNDCDACHDSGENGNEGGEKGEYDIISKEELIGKFKYCGILSTVHFYILAASNPLLHSFLPLVSTNRKSFKLA